jgi:hypothetical protein
MCLEAQALYTREMEGEDDDDLIYGLSIFLRDYGTVFVWIRLMLPP